MHKYERLQISRTRNFPYPSEIRMQSCILHEFKQQIKFGLKIGKMPLQLMYNSLVY